MSTTTNWDAYEARLNLRGHTDSERAVNTHKTDFARLASRSPDFVADALRNGKPQRLLVTRSDVNYKYNVVAFPDEPLHPGDVLAFRGEHWIVVETRAAGPYYISGIAWLCNHKFRFQNSTSIVHERYGVLDSGVYSTTTAGSQDIRYPDKQYKIYLPYDDATARISVDKRLAVDIMYDAEGNELLEVYKVTGRNRVARSYGSGAHLLILECRGGGEYNPTTDSLSEMLCDYIPPREGDAPRETRAVLIGSDKLRIGTTEGYRVALLDEDGEEISGILSATFEVTPPDDIVFATTDDTIALTAADDDALIGERFTLSATVTTDENTYTAALEVGVVPFV